MNFSKRISSLLLAASFICISLFSFNSNADSTKIYEDENMVMFEEKMNFSNITNSLNQVSDLLENNPFIELKNMGYKKPYVKNKRFSHESLGSPFYIVQGNPGGTLTINRTESASISISNNFGVSNSIIGAGTGISVGKSVSISGSKSVKIPYRYNGKIVKKGKMDIRIIYKNYKVDVYKWDTTKYTYYKAGVSNIAVPSGVDIRHWFVF